MIIEAGDVVSTSPMIAHAMKLLEDSVFSTFTTRSVDSGSYEEHAKKSLSAFRS